MAEPIRREGCVCRGDHDEDRCMIDATQDLLCRAMSTEMIGRRREDHRQQACAIDRDANDNRQACDMRKKPQAGVDRKQDARDMDKCVHPRFTSGIEAKA